MPKREKHDATIIQFEGGHSTLVRMAVFEVAAELELAAEGDHEFYFLQAPNLPDNSLAIRPSKVVALIRTHSHT